ncbi:hypothetical protein A2V71_04110 [Candidatus Berkelbacteria bacterium RBG_13_40_8]|uniref:Hcy-binding domain-containing protein n=1 Tax=Candidatus Berkelbacteria bacterium RBG_13_40_8 TaxID=1797467 RepID=A0A1F5DP54_9BACT|nr:MAG: hypothetical protein A2V71_04110 [Candidatus Berkelbacteria bacterium RBG_13_40_8]
MCTLRNALKEREFLISDGGMGTTLMEWGLKPGEFPEIWNIEHPDVVVEIHRQFIEAGVDIIQTNTFSANRHRMPEFPIRSINDIGVSLAEKAAYGRNVFLVGSIGPSGGLLKPYGDLTPEYLREVFSEQINALAESGVDGFFIETQISLEEAKIALKVAKETGLPVAVSMVFSVDCGTTSMGEKLYNVMLALENSGADVIGVNCIHPDYACKYLSEIRRVTSSGLLIAQPNAGSPHLFKGKTEYNISPEEMAGFAEEYRKLGARIIGGCCGVTPEHIKSISQRLRGLPCS